MTEAQRKDLFKEMENLRKCPECGEFLEIDDAGFARQEFRVYCPKCDFDSGHAFSTFKEAREFRDNCPEFKSNSEE